MCFVAEGLKEMINTFLRVCLLQPLATCLLETGNTVGEVSAVFTSCMTAVFVDGKI